MLLQRLSEYADRIPSTPTLYSEVVIPYVIDLDVNGYPRTGKPMFTANPKNAREKRGMRRLAPLIKRSNVTRPLLLADSSEYTFGLAREEGQEERAAQRHAAYLDLLDRCATDTGMPEVRAVQTFLHDDPVSKLTLPDDYDRGGTVTFRVDGEFVTNLPAVQAFWAREHTPDGTEGKARIMQCIVCGNERPVLNRMQGNIKGIPSGQPAGTSIISADKDAFESYGLEASLIAPTCASCGERFTKGINALLADERRCIRLGESAFIFWTREDVETLPPAMVSRPDVETINLLLRGPFTGNPLYRFRDMPFYAVSLTASGGRAVVRDWIDTTLGNAWENIARWFRWQEIVGSDGETGDPIPLYTLAAATVREVRDLPKGTSREMLRAALTGQPLPRALLAQAIRRNHAEQRITRPRAALIKMILTGHKEIEEGTMSGLDPTQPDPAYHCGRLLAVLEKIQREAIRNINATVADRFFGAASTTPYTVFPRLMRGAIPHLNKMQQSRGKYFALKEQLEDVTNAIPAQPGFPRILTLEQQGLFALGYFHQKAHDRAQAAAGGARKRANASDDTDREETVEE